MKSNAFALASFLVRWVSRSMRSVFSDKKKLSIAVLSQTLSDRLMLQTMPLTAPFTSPIA
jgi:hypothetical protein